MAVIGRQSGVIRSPNDMTLKERIAQQDYVRQQQLMAKRRRVGGLITRYFRRNSGGIDYATIPNLVLSGDYQLTMLVLKIAGQAFRVYGNNANFNSRVTINPDGSIDFRAGDATADALTAPSGSISDNVLTLIEVGRISANGFINISGLPISSGIVPTDSALINALYSQSGSVSPGIIANLRITDAGTLIRNYPINESSGVTIIDEVSSQDGTIVNGSDDDRGSFTEINKGGDWQGKDLTVPPWDSVNQVLVVA